MLCDGAACPCTTVGINIRCLRALSPDFLKPLILSSSLIKSARLWLRADTCSRKPERKKNDGLHDAEMRFWISKSCDSEIRNVSSVFQIQRLMPVNARRFFHRLSLTVVCFQWHLRVFLFIPLKLAGSEGSQRSCRPVCVSRIHCFGSALERKMCLYGHW